MVRNLMQKSRELDWSKVNNLLWEVDRLEVNRIPFEPDYGDDKLIWHYTFKGVYYIRDIS